MKRMNQIIRQKIADAMGFIKKQFKNLKLQTAIIKKNGNGFRDLNYLKNNFKILRNKFFKDS